MRLISRSRHNRRGRAPRIAISEAEITADLIYPANRRVPARDAGAARRSSSR